MEERSKEWIEEVKRIEERGKQKRKENEMMKAVKKKKKKIDRGWIKRKGESEGMKEERKK